MKVFKKHEKTEEEIQKANEKKAKIKETAIHVVKVVAGVAAFAVGGLLVLAAIGMSTDSSEESSSSESDDTIPGDDASFADHEETSDVEVYTF